MAAVLQADIRTTGEHQWEVGVAVAVSVRHATTKERHRRAQQRLAVDVLRLLEPREEVAELLDGERVVVGELFHVAFVPAVMTELVARLGDADLRNGKGVSFAAQAEGGDTRDIGLESQHDQVVGRPEVIAGLRVRNVAVGTLSVGVGDLRQRRVEPRIRSPRADLRLTNRSEVLVEASFVGRSHLLLKSPHFREVVIKDTGFAAKSPPLGCDTAFRCFEHGRENFTATTHRRELNAVCGPGERALSESNLHRRVASVLRGDSGHLLVHGDRIAGRRSNLSASQPEVNAVVMMAKASRMMQTTDGRDDLAVLFQRLKRS